MTKLRTVSILGCGWFGYPLARDMIREGYAVKGSTTTPEKMMRLLSGGVEACLMNLDEEEIHPGNFFDSEVLILGVPPRMRTGKGDRYAEKIAGVADLLKGSAVKEVVFISSTSVFPDTNAVIKENSLPSPETPSGTAILSAEKHLQNCSWFNTTIVRFSGLFGPERDPGRFFAGKTNIPNGQAPVNLIHLDDCVGIVKSILERSTFGETFHAVAPQHPSRSEFYRRAALSSGYKEPEFRDELISWKIIESQNVPGLLNYTFKRNLL